MLQDQRVDLLLRAEDLRQQGTPATPEELCRDCPELLPDLKLLLRGLGAVDRLLPVPDPGPAGVSSPTPPPRRPDPGAATLSVAAPDAEPRAVLSRVVG